MLDPCRRRPLVDASVGLAHAVFGRKAQIKTHAILEVPEALLDDLSLWQEPKFFVGPSIGAVKDRTEGSYQVRMKNITLEGFSHNQDKAVLTPEDVRPGKWSTALKAWKSARGLSDER